MTEPDQRPSPDALLAQVQQEEAQAKRGKLKIFFGASAGVGKTYAMLNAARQLRAQRHDVVVGIAETHGRAETVALLDGLEILPLKDIEYRGKWLKEFDLDAALKRRPVLILIDELAHTNVPGSRHAKRWQDIEELLAAGIDVYTTLNVQHLESLNDIVGGITGIRVWETVPDRIFDQADEISLLDLTPDELLQRLKEGKVYIPQQAEGAIQNFFRKGNLIALRELSLRRTADRVDDQMRTYRQERAIEAVWQTKESLLVCVGPKPGAEKVIRGAARMASQLGVDWHAVYVETPKLQRLPEAERARILRTLKFAHELGAQVATLAGHDAIETLIDYAHSRNLAKLVVGRDYKGWMLWRHSFADRIGRRSTDLDVVQIVRDAPSPQATVASARFSPPRPRVENLWHPYAQAVAICVLAAVVATMLSPFINLVNTAILFLLAVVVAAARYGRGPAVLAAVVSVGLFDFFFVPPRFSFAASDAQYLLTFGVMLAVALIIGRLASNLRYQGRVTENREGRLRALYEMARDLSAVLVPEQIIDLSREFIEGTFGVKIAILLADERDKLQPATAGHSAPTVDLGIAQWCFDHVEPAGFSTNTLAGSPILYLPLRAPMRTRGVLAVEPVNPRWLLIPEQRRQLDGFTALIATALERVHYIEVAQNAIVKIESERLRNSLLSALSHDLRTPLTALVGLADAFAQGTSGLSPSQREAAQAIRDQAFRMSSLVNNLLDMARLQAGEVRLRREWQPLEEVIGSALKAQESQLARHNIRVALPADLPLLDFDAVLIERVLSNLLENAAKYTPPGTEVVIEAALVDQEARISVSDNGPGLAPGSEEAVFEKFTRGERESSTPGVGLGLAICRAVVEAHGGRIWAERPPGGGARFVFTLPAGTPPEAPTFTDEQGLPGQERAIHE